MTDPKPLGLVVCMPTRGAVSIETMLCLREHLDGYPNKLLTAFRMPVVEARNQLAKEARELDPNSLDFDPHYVLWVDDDASWPASHVSKAVEILEANPEVDMVSGVFSIRMAYRNVVGITPANQLLDEVMLRHKPGELIPVKYAGAHWNLMRRSLLDKVGDEPFNRLPWDVLCAHDRTLAAINKLCDADERGHEDYSFCYRVGKAGGKIVTERSLLVGHVSVSDGRCYFPWSPALTANGLEAPYYTDECAASTLPERRGYFAECDGNEVWKRDIAGDLKPPPTESPAEAQTPKPSSVVRFIRNASDALRAVPAAEAVAIVGSCEALQDRCIRQIIEAERESPRR
jgi:hypothetical protein